MSYVDKNWLIEPKQAVRKHNVPQQQYQKNGVDHVNGNVTTKWLVMT